MKLYMAALSAAALALLAALPALAQTAYYADVGLQLLDNGNVVVSGITNHPGLSSGVHGEYTSKTGSYWLLNVTVPGTFSDYVYTLRMPAGSTVNYIKSSGRVSIGQEGEGIVIEGTGRVTEFSLVVQYAIAPQEAFQLWWWAFPLPVAVALLLVFGWMLVRRKKPAEAKGDVRKASEMADAARARYNPSLLTERQLAIVKALERAGKPMTQRQIEQALSLPKASVSRNISSLVRAGILIRHSRGMSNAVWFSEKAAKG